MSGVLIVGASHAGVSIAAALRELDYQGDVTLVGAEHGYPYERPPLSKDYLLGKADREALALRTHEFYESRAIQVQMGTRIRSVNLDAGVATSDEHEFGFEHLALATGARPRRLTIAGSELPGVHYLREVADADRLAWAFGAAERVVVVGGGFIGLEAAAVARTKGKQVTVLEAADRLIARAVAPVVSQFLDDLHTSHGVDVRLNAALVGFKEKDRLTGLVLADGTILPADIAIVGVGVIARTELAEQMGLEVQNGIVVDAGAVTSDPRVVAAGDVTLSPHPFRSDVLVRIESVQNATEQAKVAARSILGLPHGRPEVPWFWSSQYDRKLQIAGLSNDYDQVVQRGDSAAGPFSVLYFRVGRLIAVDAFDRPADFMAVRRGLKEGLTVDSCAASDSEIPLKSLMS